MAIKNKTAICLMAISIAACSNKVQIEDLQRENQRLSNALMQEKEEAIKAAWQNEYSASIYNGCAWPTNSVFLCPESVISKGQKAINAGAAGASWPLWAAIFSKLLVLLGIIYALIYTVMNWLGPKQEQIDQAIKLINEAASKVAIAERELLDIEKESALLKKSILANNKIVSMQRKTIQELDIAIENKKAENIKLKKIDDALQSVFNY